MVEGISVAAAGSIASAIFQRTRQTLEAAFGHVMRIVAIERFDMQGHAGIRRKGLKKFAHQIDVEIADLVARKLDPEHEHRPAGNVDRDAGQRFVHRQMQARVARDPAHIAERLFDRLADHDADVFGRVVLVDVEIALGLDLHIDPRMAGEQIQHVIEKADAGRNLVLALAIEIDLHRDLGFLGFAGDFAGTHRKAPGRRGF